MPTKIQAHDATFPPPTNTGLAALEPPRLRVYLRRYRMLRRDALRRPDGQPTVDYIDAILAELRGALRVREGAPAA